jgi:energy-coupling factor transport system ATP-binding protein
VALLEIDNLSYTYPGEDKPALKDINLIIEKGDFVGVTGPTGAGKTTLTYCLNGIIPHYMGGAVQGNISLKGNSVFNMKPAEISRLLGSVFQDPEAQITSPEVEQEIAFGLENLGFDPAEIKARIDDSLEFAGIKGLRHYSTAELSGGQKQRVAIAAALAPLPEILVLDEPTSELDPMGTEEIFKTLVRLNSKHGITIIIIEQKTEQLAQHAKKMVVLNSGSVVLEGKPWQVFSRQKELEEIGVRIPQVTQLGAMLGCGGKDFLPLTVKQGYWFIEKYIRRNVR